MIQMPLHLKKKGIVLTGYTSLKFVLLFSLTNTDIILKTL